MKVTRREFLKLSAGAAAIAALGAVGYSLFPRQEVQEKVYETPLQNPFTSGGLPIVAMVKGKQPEECVREAFKSLGSLGALIKPSHTVLIKPNLGFRNPEACTSPLILSAVIDAVKEAKPSRIFVADSSVRGSDTTEHSKATGLADICAKHNVEFVDLRKATDIVTVKTGQAAKTLKSIQTWSRVKDADVIVSVPRLKRHVTSRVTVSMKNMMGAVTDDQKGQYHELGVHQCIADALTVLRPSLALVDATEVMTRYGPERGTMVRADTVIASGDPVAADLLSSKLLFELEELSNPGGQAAGIQHIELADQMGLGAGSFGKIKTVERTLT